MLSDNNAPGCAIAWLTITAQHPCLPGHFPGQPVVPGVVLLERMLELLHDHLPAHNKLTGLPSVKFLHPALPDTLLLMGIELTSTTHGRFICRCKQQTLAQGSFTLLNTPTT